MRLVYYVSGHGMGHAVRTTEIIRALAVSTPDLAIQIRTTASRGIFERNLSPCPDVYVLAPGRALDVGLIQLDCLHPDFETTYQQVVSLLERAEELIEAERRAIVNFRADAVVSDIPFLAPAAARAAGRPSAVLANFTWDWVYLHYAEKFPAWREPAMKIRDYYRAADLVVRFPLSPDMPQFDRVIQAGLTGRSSRKPGVQVRKELGIPENAGLILITLADVVLDSKAKARMLAENPGTVFMYSGPADLWGEGFLYIPEGRFYYPDLIKAADAVLTKPGYGIVTDALANDTPIVYTDRGDFPEYPYLVKAIQSWLPHGYIPSSELYAGAVAGYIGNLAAPSGGLPHPGRIHGAVKAAEAILGLGQGAGEPGERLYSNVIDRDNQIK